MYKNLKIVFYLKSHIVQYHVCSWLHEETYGNQEKHPQQRLKLQTLQIITDGAEEPCTHALQTPEKLPSIRGFAKIFTSRTALVTLATV